MNGLWNIVNGFPNRLMRREVLARSSPNALAGSALPLPGRSNAVRGRILTTTCLGVHSPSFGRAVAGLAVTLRGSADELCYRSNAVTGTANDMACLSDDVNGMARGLTGLALAPRGPERIAKKSTCALSGLVCALGGSTTFAHEVLYPYNVSAGNRGGFGSMGR